MEQKYRMGKEMGIFISHEKTIFCRVYSVKVEGAS